MMIILLNLLTISRIFIGLLIFILLIFDSFLLAAFILFIFAGLTDYLDGYLARKYDAKSQIGEILDPIADKILVVFLFFGLTINLSSYIIGFAGALIISREIWVSALRDFNARNNNLNECKNSYQDFNSWSDFMEAEIEASQDSLSIDREEDF